MTPRAAIAQHFRQQMPGTTWHVQGYPNEPDTITRNTLIIYTERIRKAGLGAGVYQATLVLFLAVPTSKPDRVEDRLDDALETVLGVLEDYGSLTWDEVERSTLAEKFHGYRITTTAAYSSSEQE